MDQESIVRYWHAVELLPPQDAPKRKLRGGIYDAFIHDTPIARPVLPWDPESIVAGEKLPREWVWSHTLYAHLYDNRCIAEQLQAVFGADQGYREPQFRESALFALKFDRRGRMVEDSFVLSSEAWFIGRVLAGRDWTWGFDGAQQAIREDIKSLLHRPVSADDLQRLTRWLLEEIGVADFFATAESPRFRFRSRPVRPDRVEQEDDPLNSFLLDDLANVADSIGDGVSSRALDQYLSRHDPGARLHVDDDGASRALIGQLMPDAYPDGCWPTERHLGLVHSQQLAVNTIMERLAESEGLLGVNGPPGTGKTTLLRDLIAAIVTRRADALAALPRASDAFVRNGRETGNDGGRERVCFTLAPSFFGFEIVVASSNNGAVENVTLELPQRDKIDESWLPDAEYFADLGELITGKPAWGMISAALGSKARRGAFVRRYFYGDTGAVKKTAAAEVPSATTGDVLSEDALAIDELDLESAAETEEDVNEPVEEEDEPKGLFGWLSEKMQANEGRSPEQRKAIWRRAVAEYTAAKAAARAIAASAERIRELVGDIGLNAARTADEQDSLRAIEQELEDTRRQLARLDAGDAKTAGMALERVLAALGAHLRIKPGWLDNLFSLWGAQRRWKRALGLLETQRGLAQFEWDRVARLIRQLDGAREELEARAAAARREIDRLQALAAEMKRDAAELADACGAEHLLAWLRDGAIGRGEAIELAEPWRIDGWRQARARVFIEALKLHRMFFELEPSRLRANLFMANEMVKGGRFHGFSRDAIRSAWASLFMVTPVLSSTFASFARSFSSLEAGEIGWLLVDEAGQAPPQAAVGALWRARRALMVGDPLQLKPIINVSDAALEHMRTGYDVDAHWLPNRQSAQTLADEATTWGRMIGPVGGKTWVGLPLAVHRRCDRPMFDLANRIAYDGAMVYGTIAPGPDKETPASLATGWIDARGASEGNWVPAEGEALRNLLAALRADGVSYADISVVTPFKNVVQRLRPMLGGKMVNGTIHTMQGKESAVVILVLGGNTAGPGARDWAVSEPNLLNVAATRAKRRFYVIGDRSDWQQRALFCDVMDLLPGQSLIA